MEVGSSMEICGNNGMAGKVTITNHHTKLTVGHSHLSPCNVKEYKTQCNVLISK